MLVLNDCFAIISLYTACPGCAVIKEPIHYLARNSSLPSVSLSISPLSLTLSPISILNLPISKSQSY